MKKLLQVFVLITGLFMVANSCSAQRNALADITPKERAELQTNLVVQALALSDSVQIKKVGDINFKYAKKLEDIVSSNANRRSKFKKLRNMSEKKEAELKNALTEEQFASYLKKKEEIMRQMKERLQQRRSDGR